MSVMISTIVSTIINVAVLVVIIIGINKSIKCFKNYINTNKKMEKKIDIILNKLENKEDKEHLKFLNFHKNLHNC